MINRNKKTTVVARRLHRFDRRPSHRLRSYKTLDYRSLCVDGGPGAAIKPAVRNIVRDPIGIAGNCLFPLVREVIN